MLRAKKIHSQIEHIVQDNTGKNPNFGTVSFIYAPPVMTSCGEKESNCVPLCTIAATLHYLDSKVFLAGMIFFWCDFCIFGPYI